MRKIDLPVSNVQSIVAACAQNIQNRELATRLVAAQKHFTQYEKTYAALARDNQLYTFPVEEITYGITQKEMSWLYSKAFSRKGSVTRPIYDEIKALAHGEICPLCNQRIVSTLDHHLSKQDYPAFAVTPINLVPSCRDCNSDTLARKMHVSDDQTFHPYFDNVDDEIWLFAFVEQVIPPVVRFQAIPPKLWDHGKRIKVEHHFQTFKLGMLYTVHAGSELQNIYGDIEAMDRNGGAQAICNELTQRALARRRVVRNTWQAAMYEALASSNWFCQGGFRGIDVF